MLFRSLLQPRVVISEPRDFHFALSRLSLKTSEPCAQLGHLGFGLLSASFSFLLGFQSLRQLSPRGAGLGAEKIVITGAWTNMSVEMTTRQGADNGYEVVVVSDGTSTVNEDFQKAALEYAVPNLAEVATTDEVIAALG